MTNIIKTDPYIDQYIIEKQIHPDTKIVLKSFQRKVVEDVDSIVELAKGYRETISSENDWVIVEALVKFFAKRWPDEFNEFVESIPLIKEAKGEGYSKSREMMHVGSLPPRLMRIIKAIFPLQQWDKKFVSKFVRRFPLFKVGEVKK